LHPSLQVSGGRRAGYASRSGEGAAGRPPWIYSVDGSLNSALTAENMNWTGRQAWVPGRSSPRSPCALRSSEWVGSCPSAPARRDDWELKYVGEGDGVGGRQASPDRPSSFAPSARIRFSPLWPLTTHMRPPFFVAKVVDPMDHPAR